MQVVRFNPILCCSILRNAPHFFVSTSAIPVNRYLTECDFVRKPRLLPDKLSKWPTCPWGPAFPRTNCGRTSFDGYLRGGWIQYWKKHYLCGVFLRQWEFIGWGQQNRRVWREDEIMTEKECMFAGELYPCCTRKSRHGGVEKDWMSYLFLWLFQIILERVGEVTLLLTTLLLWIALRLLKLMVCMSLYTLYPFW